jgi:hypothetical protein
MTTFLETTMLKPILATGIAGLLLLSGPGESSDRMGAASLALEPAVNGAVSADGLFPSQEMQDEFSAYLRWAKEQGISRLRAFEPLAKGGTAADADLASERMEEQFAIYLSWVEEQGISPFYAISVTDFD